MLVAASRLAALAALSSCAAGPSACTPVLGDSAAQLERRCGAPSAVYRAEGSVLSHEEWLYDGDVYVGLIDGSVTYILK